MRVTLRLPDDLGNTIRWQAWEGRRSFNSEVVSWLEAYLESHPAASGTPDARSSAKATSLPSSTAGPAHDSANCRLYGCGLCRAAGIKDARRGL